MYVQMDVEPMNVVCVGGGGTCLYSMRGFVLVGYVFYIICACAIKM